MRQGVSPELLSKALNRRPKTPNRHLTATESGQEACLNQLAPGDYLLRGWLRSQHRQVVLASPFVPLKPPARRTRVQAD